MFIKKGIEKALFDLKKYFPYLFDGRFRVVATKYEREHFGNWIIVLHSKECGIRVYQDRRQIFVMVAPPWASAGMTEVDHYFDIRLLTAFLEKSENIDFEADLQHIELQYQEVSKDFLFRYEKIIQLVNSPDFAKIEKELHKLRERILAKRFPEIFGEKP